MQGNIKSPDYPSNYPANAYCLWLVKVPEAKKIEVRVEDFELEEDRYCRSDRMIIFDKMSKEPIYGCGKMAPNKNFTGDNFMVEFQSDGSTEKRGFNLRYNSYFKKDLISASTQKPTTTMKKEGKLKHSGLAIIFVYSFKKFILSNLSSGCPKKIVSR